MLFAAGPAGAALVPLDTSNPDFSDDRLNDGDTATDGSIVLTFGDVLALGSGNEVKVDEDGIYLADDNVDPLAAGSFSIVFDTNTLIDQYTVGFTQDSVTGGFQLAGANGTSGLNDMSSTGTFTFDMGSIPYLTAGQAYTLTHTLSTQRPAGLSQLKSFNISEGPTPAPAPATALLLAGGCSDCGRCGGRRGAIEPRSGGNQGRATNHLARKGVRALIYEVESKKPPLQ